MKRIKAILPLALSVLLAASVASAQSAIHDAGITGAAASPAAEYWRLGVTVEGPPASSALVGRAVSPAAAFRSNHSTSDIYFAFPTYATSLAVQSAQFYLLSRAGAYSGAATLTLEVLNAAGAVQHTASAASMDLQAAAVGVWTPIPLSGTFADVTIDPGEFLAFHFQLSGAPGGNLDVRPAFEVQVRPSTLMIYLPIILRN